MRHSLAVRESFRFALREAVGGGRVASYTLRGSDAVVCLRHDERDSWVLHEVLATSNYAPPPAAMATLNATQRPLRVVDAGAHLGFFGLFVLARHPGAEITAFEPDPSNAALLEECIRRNGSERQWHLVRACASTEDGSAWFASGLGEWSHVSPEPESGTIEVPVVDLFRHLDGVDLLKMDIEGGEWRILADQRLAIHRPKVVVLEYHPRFCPDPDPKRAAETRLTELGYLIEEGTLLRPGVGTLLAWLPPAAHAEDPGTNRAVASVA